MSEVFSKDFVSLEFDSQVVTRQTLCKSAAEYITLSSVNSFIFLSKTGQPIIGRGCVFGLPFNIFNLTNSHTVHGPAGVADFTE